MEIREPSDSDGACVLLRRRDLAQFLARCSFETSCHQGSSLFAVSANLREMGKEFKLTKEEFQAADPVKPTRWVCGPQSATEVIVDGRDRE